MKENSSIEAERMVLSGMATNDELLAAGIQCVKDKDFTEIHNLTIFLALKDLTSKEPLLT